MLIGLCDFVFAVLLFTLLVDWFGLVVANLLEVVCCWWFWWFGGFWLFLCFGGGGVLLGWLWVFLLMAWVLWVALLRVCCSFVGG